MKLHGRTLAWWAGGAALAVALGLWLTSATEWATRDAWEPPKGEAATDPHFIVKQFLARLGATVTEQRGLATMPPQGSTMLLQAYHWRFLAGRPEALKAWVEQGGHLVVFHDVGKDETIEKWLGVDFRPEPKPRRAEAASAPASAGSQPAAEAGDDESGDDAWNEDDENEEEDDEPCPPLTEPIGQPGWYGTARRYDVCASGDPWLKTSRPMLWSVSDPVGVRALRLQVGRGSVTLSTAWTLPRRARLLDEDEGALLAALVQLRPGQPIWLVLDEESPGIVATLWRQAPMAVLLSITALLLLLWRWGTRFAPLVAETPLGRRSMAEQVRGTAAYLLRHGPAALHRAQWRALNDAAEAHLPGWRRMNPAQRIAALAQHAGLPTAELDKACHPASLSDAASTGRALALMEAARRRLVEPAPPGARPTPPAPPPSSSPEPTP
jgi:hypothetical protein